MTRMEIHLNGVYKTNILVMSEFSDEWYPAHFSMLQFMNISEIVCLIIHPASYISIIELVLIFYFKQPVIQCNV